ncbi:MAG: flagellar basal body P-ring formation chaperone FlgA [Thermoguttaceae bacterium]
MQRILISFAVVLIAVGQARAAELRLRRQCAAHSAVVKLGDVAEIFSDNVYETKKLAAMELFPAPTTSRQRVLRLRELQDLLTLRGVNLAEQQFSGSSRILLTSASEAGADQDQITIAVAKRSQRRVQDAVLQYLRSKAAFQGTPTLQFELLPALARAAANSTGSISISGGSAPWTGIQRFEATIDAPDGPSRWVLQVRVSAPLTYIAALHSLSRGQTIRETDLKEMHEAPRNLQAGTFHAAEDLIGKQTTRAIVEGKIFTSDDVQSPLLIHRGDITTVYARCAGIKVHATARAREDGALGDIVTLETIHDRKTYQARVCGAREAEVFAKAMSAK